jgi:hypothetical protein
MIDTHSNIFFLFFFLAIVVSVVLTYDAIYVRGDFQTFTEDNVPEAIDSYYTLWNLITNRSE